MYLSEVCQKIVALTGIEVSPATICRVIRRNRFTRKKLRRVAMQQSVEQREGFLQKFCFVMSTSSCG